MYTLLALACFVIIALFLLGEITDDQTKPSKNDGSVFPAVLGGVLLAPVLALGAVLFALGKVAVVIPALLYGLFVLLQRFFEWVWEHVREIAAHVTDALRDVGRRMHHFLLSLAAGKRIQEFFVTWREAGRTVVRFFRRLPAALENLLERARQDVRSVVQRVGRFVRASNHRRAQSWDRRVASSRSSQRATSERSRAHAGWLVPLVRTVRAFQGRSRDADDRDFRSARSKRRAFSLLALLALWGAKRRANQREKSQEGERRTSAGERVHGSRFARKTEAKISSLYQGRYERGRISFRRVSSPASRQSDVLKNLRAVGWRVRSKIDRL